MDDVQTLLINGGLVAALLEASKRALGTHFDWTRFGALLALIVGVVTAEMAIFLDWYGVPGVDWKQGVFVGLMAGITASGLNRGVTQSPPAVVVEGTIPAKPATATAAATPAVVATAVIPTPAVTADATDPAVSPPLPVPVAPPPALPPQWSDPASRPPPAPLQRLPLLTTKGRRSVDLRPSGLVPWSGDYPAPPPSPTPALASGAVSGEPVP